MSAGWAKAAVEKKVGIRSWEVQTKDEYLKSLVTKFQPLLLKSFAVHQQPLLLSPEVNEWERDRADVTLNELTK